VTRKTALTPGQILKAAEALRRTKGELAWLIDFVQRDPGEPLKDLQKCQREMLAFCMTRGSGTTIFPSALPTTAAAIDRIAEKLRSGILHVVTGDEEIWEVPGPPQSRMLIGRRESDGSITVFDQALMAASISLETSMAMVAQALIVENQSRVCVCKRKDCGRLFMKVRRQEFCSVRCSDYQRKRDWRAQGGKTRANENRLKREAYRRRQKEES
jgi:hypothetical protein